MKVLTRESWIIPWPLHEAKRPRLKDLFEGLA